MEQPAGLISVLLDPSARGDARADAAMDLSEFDDPRVELALLQAAASDGDEMVVTSCCESLAEIWCRRGSIAMDRLNALPEAARNELTPLLQQQCPDLVKPKPPA